MTAIEGRVESRVVPIDAELLFPKHKGVEPMRTQLQIATGIVFTVTACGGGASSGALARACVKIGDMTEEICDCVATKADERLSSDGRAFVLAVLEDDEVEATRLREGLPIDEAMTAGMFMAQAPLECAGEDENN